ncbi:MAG TPA: helix-turn-helix domain-containing protein [Candidatus Limnocylindrales bacterium]|nr:helix-turn-helix domain-containing protein [Candidatus Limnocylindrales bacterium]
MSTTTSGRRHRSDGARSHEAILEAAARLASTRGLDRLSIGELADAVGISKSGLYAHFGSKEELQLATIDAAEEVFDRVVVARAESAKPGLPRVLALCDAHLDHLRDRIFPGGCFFACASAEMHARPGAVKDRVAAFDGRWQARFRRHLAIARQDGDLPDEDLEAVLFDIDAILYYAHGAFSFRDDPAVLEQAREAVRRRLRVA